MTLPTSEALARAWYEANPITVEEVNSYGEIVRRNVPIPWAYLDEYLEIETINRGDLRTPRRQDLIDMAAFIQRHITAALIADAEADPEITIEVRSWRRCGCDCGTPILYEQVPLADYLRNRYQTGDTES